MERIWIIVASCLGVVGVALLWFHRFDGAFVCGAVGVLAWFLSLRSRLRKNIPMVENISKSKAEGIGVQDED